MAIGGGSEEIMRDLAVRQMSLKTVSFRTLDHIRGHRL